MSAPDFVDGAAPLGRLVDLPPLERQVVVYVRLWSEGVWGRTEIRADLAARHGAECAGSAAQALDALLRTAVAHARRPLIRHGLGCPCAGADECVFARFVALAAGRAREDAVLIASLLIRADMAMILARQAQTLGLTLMRGQSPRAAEPAPAPAEVHRWH